MWMSICFCTFSLTSFSSVQFSCSVFSNSLRSHELQHVRLPCPTPTPGACSNSCPLSQWYHPTISSSVIPFSCLKSFPASGSFPVTQLFESGDQSTEASASSSVLTMITQDWFPLGFTDFDLLAVQATPKSLLQHHSLKASVLSFIYGPTLISIHDYWKNHSFDYTNLCWQSNVSAF